MPKKVRAGIIGVGTMGAHHARVYALLPEVEFIGVSDLDYKKAKEVGERYKVRAFSNYQDLLKEIQAVSLVTPTQAHHKMGLEILSQGIHLLVEKPLAKMAQEAQALIETARQKDLILATGHIERFNPAFSKLKELLQSQKILSLQAKRLSPFPERISDASVVLDMMIHDLDLVLSLASSPLEDFKARGERIKTSLLDRVSVDLTFKNDLRANLQADRLYKEKVRSLRVDGEGVTFELDLLRRSLSMNKKEIAVPQRDQLEEELKNFVHGVTTGDRPLVSGEDGLKALELALEIEKACP